MTFRKLEQVIVGSVNGKPFKIARTEAIENALEELKARNATHEEVMALVASSRKEEIAGSCKYLAFNPTSQEYFLELDGKRSKHPLPTSLVKYIEESYDKNIDFLPLVKAWARLLANPRYSSAMAKYFNTYLSTTYVDREQVAELIKEGYTPEAAENMCSYPDISITEEGLLATYKVAEIVTWEYKMEWNKETETFEKVKSLKYEQIAPKLDPVTGEVLEEGSFKRPEFAEDFVFTPAIYKNGAKFYSDNVLGYVYHIGKMQHLPANAPRNLSNTFGGGGLYSGGLRYIENYKNSGTHVLTCFVNPSDILSFQSEGNAFRTDALFPNNVWDENVKLRAIYHSSDYDKLSSERLESIIQDALERGVDLKEEQENLSDC